MAKKIKKKTKKALAKRIRVTKTGKIKRVCAGRNHLASSKSPNQKRRLRKARIMSPGDYKRLKDLL